MKGLVNQVLKDREIGILKASKEIGIAYETLRRFLQKDANPREEILNKIHKWVNKYNSLEPIPSRKEKKKISHTIDGTVSGITLSFSKDKMEINIQFK